MTIPNLPLEGDTSWYDWATSLDTEARTIAAKETPAGAQAKADAAQAAAVQRANHTGTQTASTVSDFASAARAQTEAELIAGTNVTITPAGAGETRTLTIASSGAGGMSPASPVAGTTTYPSFFPGQTPFLRNTGLTMVANTIYNVPFETSGPWTPADMLIQVATAAAASGVRLWIYNSGTDWQPTTLALDVGEFDVSTTGVKTITGLTTTMGAGRYVYQLISNGAPVLASNRITPPGVSETSLTAWIQTMEKSAGTYGAAPTTGVPWTAASTGNNSVESPAYWR